jgi:hypothetical protein
MSIVIALMITLAIEVNIFIFLKRDNIFLWLVASIMNVILNVGMNVLLYFMPTTFWYWFTLSAYEISTLVIEGLIIFLIFKYKFFKCLLVSLIANTASFLVGLFINQFTLNLWLQITLISVFMILYLVGFALTTYRFAKNRFLN